MTYIILYDTFGNGLKPFTSLGLEVYNKDQLEEAVAVAAQDLLDAEACETMEEYDDLQQDVISISNTIVICEITERIGCMSVENYIKEVVKQKEDTGRKERYELYLKLKEEFRE
jgi:hemerythrin-like domain-containing protein